MQLILPEVMALEERRGRNSVLQLAERQTTVEGRLIPFQLGRIAAHLFIASGSNEQTLIVPKATSPGHNHNRIICASIVNENDSIDLREGIWVKHPLLRRPGFDHQQAIRTVLDSWVRVFSYVEEDATPGARGLRRPQLGAVHAIHMHWSTSDSPATIVMPTGTGKTETMLAILVSVRCPRLLVVVPTDALRKQIADKFIHLGILKEPNCAVLAGSALYPIVGILEHIPASTSETDDVFTHSQVIVTTASILGRCSSAVQAHIAELSPYLFIDEAHHAEAPTWSSFRERFKQCRVVQFTATPFREDDKPLEGQIVFKYPLKRAQQEGYFQPIRFRQVIEFDRHQSDIAIASAAIEQLRQDADRGHILMARVDTVRRANEVFRIYSQYPEFRPVQLHTGIRSAAQRETARRQILRGESRVVVCVDMLGEGFDLPELKIAAFHDIRKSLAVTLQLAGRFIRARPDLGNATFIANVAEVEVQEELRKLYSRDPDWNILLPELSDQMVGEQVSLQEFLAGFTDFAEEIPIRTLRPATSTVVYKTNCANWSPENYKSGIPGIRTCEQVHATINSQAHTLVVVTARRAPLEWTNVETVFDWQWELYIVIWSREQHLLFINGSTNAGEFKALAHSVVGNDAVLINGHPVFRSFANVNRLRLQNVGLTQQFGKNIRYTGRMGGDVEPAIQDLHRRHAQKSVLSGTGFENGRRVTVGASRNGRIWSHQRDRIDEFSAWCKGIGEKLLNDEIDPDEVLKGTLVPRAVAARPDKMPITIDWPEEMYTTPEAAWSVSIDEQQVALSDLEINLADPSTDGPLNFIIAGEGQSAELRLELYERDGTKNYKFVLSAGRKLEIRRGGSRWDIAEFFYRNPPVIWFVDGSSLEGNQHAQLSAPRPPYDASTIQAWDWSGVNIRNESQGTGKDQTSIQARVIRELKTRPYDVIVDDDASGEAADIVSVALMGDKKSPSSIEVEFYHCKFSAADAPGRRIEDLYEVCGQAQKSISWASSPTKLVDLFTHLLRRDASRRASVGVTRFEVGDANLLHTIREMSRMCPVVLRILIVQPGVSRANASPDQLQLLSVTQSYLFETYRVPFGVIASA